VTEAKAGAGAPRIERLGPRLWRAYDRQGRGYTLRPLVPDDAQALMRAFAREAPEDRLMRLFSAMPKLPERLARRLCTVDPARDVALVFLADDAPGELAGGARVMRGPDEASGEYAVSVASDRKGSGLGRMALEAALAVAAEMGVRRVWGTVARRNSAMRGLARRLGMTDRADPDDPTLVITEMTLPSSATDRE
jgi:acetyltransferase